jgi:hypothetical protein
MCHADEKLPIETLQLSNGVQPVAYTPVKLNATVSVELQVKPPVQTSGPQYLIESIKLGHRSVHGRAGSLRTTLSNDPIL